MATAGNLILLVLYVCIVLLIARFVLDWVQMLARDWRPKGFVLVLCEAIYSTTDPPLRAVRGLIPAVRLGGAALDLSPLILLIGIWILQTLTRAVFF